MESSVSGSVESGLASGRKNKSSKRSEAGKKGAQEM